uniref:DDE_Tnp_1_7 domain-containing protein n=1 Tax=Strongyloides papillosus TaxID=174720 RepID=A0A0N5C5G0_STREA
MDKIELQDDILCEDSINNPIIIDDSDGKDSEDEILSADNYELPFMKDYDDDSTISESDLCTTAPRCGRLQPHLLSASGLLSTKRNKYQQWHMELCHCSAKELQNCKLQNRSDTTTVPQNNSRYKSHIKPKNMGSSGH